MFYIPQIVLFGAAERNVDLNYLKGVFFFFTFSVYMRNLESVQLWFKFAALILLTFFLFFFF